ncbi:hypothetical protein [Flavobacterium johnsoniae]|nr:hypothetical protein [Flavobacterium johnsoniae]
MHPVWNKGKVLAVDREKNQYTVHFFEMGKEKPIDFSFRFLTAGSDAEPESSSPAELLNIQENLKNAPDPFADQEQQNGFADNEDSRIFNDKNTDSEKEEW